MIPRESQMLRKESGDGHHEAHKEQLHEKCKDWYADNKEYRAAYYWQWYANDGKSCKRPEKQKEKREQSRWQQHRASKGEGLCNTRNAN